MNRDDTEVGRSAPGLPEHLPLRPIWLCRACGQPWPCGRARLALLAEYRDNQVGLIFYLAGLLHEAIDDLHRLNPTNGFGHVGNMFDRFLGWPTRRHSRRPPTAAPTTPEET